MKKLLLGLAVSLTSFAAFTQGKISFQTDSLHLVFYNPFFARPGDGSLAGQGVDLAHMPHGVTLVADLYMGTSSSMLYLYSSTTFGSVPGRWNSMQVLATTNSATGAPAIPGGTSVFVIAAIRDDRSLPPNVFNRFPDGGGAVYAYSSEFTFTLGSSLTYPPMWGANGNWAPGTFPLDQYGTGSRGAIDVDWVPEPSTFALALLGGLLLGGGRRRKC